MNVSASATSPNSSGEMSRARIAVETSTSVRPVKYDP